MIDGRVRTSLWWTWCERADDTVPARRRRRRGSSAAGAWPRAAVRPPASRGSPRSHRRRCASPAAKNADWRRPPPPLCSNRGDTAPSRPPRAHHYTRLTIRYTDWHLWRWPVFRTKQFCRALYRFNGHNLAEKISVGLASHWSCVTDFTGLTIYGLNAWKEEQHPTNAPAARFTFTFTSVSAFSDLLTPTMSSSCLRKRLTSGRRNAIFNALQVSLVSHFKTYCVINSSCWHYHMYKRALVNFCCA